MEAIIINANDDVTIEDAYQLVHQFIDKLAWKLVRNYGGRYEDIRADANTSFVHAFNDVSKDGYRSGHKYFLCGLRYWVWFEFLDWHRPEFKRAKYLGPSLDNMETEPTDVAVMNKKIGLLDMIDSLSTDSKEAVGLVLNMPEDLRNFVVERGGARPQHRRAFKDYLRNNGWNPRKIKKCFKEVQEALYS